MHGSISTAISRRNGRSYDSHGESSNSLEIIPVLMDNGEELPVRKIDGAAPDTDGDTVISLKTSLKIRSLIVMPMVLVAAFTLSGAHCFAQSHDLVSGNLVQFDDNGIWTWYSDERTVVDTNGNKLVVGCVENAAGLGGLDRDGNINVTRWDVPSGMGPRLRDAFAGMTILCGVCYLTRGQ